MSAPDFILLVVVVVAGVIAAIAAWEYWNGRCGPETDPFGDDRPSDEAIRHLRKRNGRTL